MPSLPSQVWMFQRFTVVMEYQQKPVLPPPFIAFCHFYSLLKYCVRKAKGEPGMSKFSFVPCEWNQLRFVLSWIGTALIKQSLLFPRLACCTTWIYMHICICVLVIIELDNWKISISIYSFLFTFCSHLHCSLSNRICLCVCVCL